MFHIVNCHSFVQIHSRNAKKKKKKEILFCTFDVAVTPSNEKNDALKFVWHSILCVLNAQKTYFNETKTAK